MQDLEDRKLKQHWDLEEKHMDALKNEKKEQIKADKKKWKDELKVRAYDAKTERIRALAEAAKAGLNLAENDLDV